MKTRLITRNIIIGTQRTTVRLEAAIWEALDDICVRERISRHELCTRVEQNLDGGNRAQGIRTLIINYCLLSMKQGTGVTDTLAQAMQYNNDVMA